MKARQLPSFFILLSSISGFCATITGSGMSFSPPLITISQGEVVDFVFDLTHNAVEVSQATWNNNQGTKLTGGFEVGQGGGSVNNLSVGEHWYVCQFHISNGMKGRIIVTALGINDFQLVKNFNVFPNPVTDFLTVKANENVQDLIYRLIDVNGREIQSGKLEDVSTSVNMSQFTAGVYFLQVGDDRRQVFRIVKQ